MQQALNLYQKLHRVNITHTATSVCTEGVRGKILAPLRNVPEPRSSADLEQRWRGGGVIGMKTDTQPLGGYWVP